MRTELARIIRKNFDQIQQQWTRAMVDRAGPNYRKATIEDIQKSNVQCLEAFLSYIQTGNPEMIRQWNHRITFKRSAGAFGAKPGFEIDEIQQALFLFREVLLRLVDEDEFKKKQFLEITDIIADTLQTAITDLSRKYLVVMEKRLLGRHFAPALVDRLVDGCQTISISKSAKVTIFFSDIRGFTRISQQLDREEMIEILDAYFAEMTKLVFAHGGTLDKFLGDGLMAFFGEPEPAAVEEQALRAIGMSVKMLAAVERLKQGPWRSYADSPVSVGIGINTGFVTVGHVGTKDRMEYTVLGSNVNLAARLQGAAKAGQILVTRRTLEPIKDALTYEELGSMTFKNIAEPVPVFNVTGVKESR